MAIDKAIPLAQIDDVFAEGQDRLLIIPYGEFMTLVAKYSAAIDRLAPPGSQFVQLRDTAKSVFSPQALARNPASRHSVLEALEGVLMALRSEYDAGRLQTFQELVHADIFKEFLGMAEYFLDEGYKDPAAVIAGGVLEEHLRKLCAKLVVVLPPKPAIDKMNVELAKANAYGKNEQKQITAWAGLRNDAAHGSYGNYTAPEVKLMIAGIRDFIIRNPA